MADKIKNRAVTGLDKLFLSSPIVNTHKSIVIDALKSIGCGYIGTIERVISDNFGIIYEATNNNDFCCLTLDNWSIIRNAKIFQYIDTAFVVQAYLKDDFANICEVNGDSFRINFRNKAITTTSKESKEWQNKASMMNISEVKNIIDNLFIK